MYKLKKGFTLPKEFKIRVTPEQSEALQKYLFSIGKRWGNGDEIVQWIDTPFLYIYDNNIFLRNHDENDFYDHKNRCVNFDHYFEKVQESFPEKWCIEVTEDNYKELNTWMHKNWTNYDGYKDTWAIDDDAISFYFHSEGELKDGWGQPSKRDSTFTLITTEQFRAKYSKEHVNDVGALIKDMEEMKVAIDNTSNAARFFSEEFLKMGKLVFSESKINAQSAENVEILRLTKENEQLKYKLLVLTSKIEAAKIVLD